MGDRNYSKATEAVLFALSTKCYFPDCNVPSVSILGRGDEKKNVDIAHIVPVSPRWPRYRPMNKQERDSFTNLILLCKAHHPRVDRHDNEHMYPESLLLEWKEENEKGLRAKIDGLDRLTEDRLEELLTTAIQSGKHEIRDALDELKEVSAGAADLLYGLIDRIEDSYIDAESISLLYAASERLGFLEEGATLMYSASENLGEFESNALTLDNAANKLADIDFGQFAAASQRLEQFTNDCPAMMDSFPQPTNISGDIETAGRIVVAEIENTVRTINVGQLPTIVDDEQRWKYGLVGFALGVAAVLATVIILASNGAV
ncbi:hypothetical protein CFN78_23745 [Amycolatopsis antarctica]|uniref:HNH nuclease domain-containing protein n=1 Tax=Amycolatopsis antarctica TaxID=1854586 RepID=A0A263CX12_9PSEU|nr:HNH endonuclease signature motif containing protein [Amycolatopsis antarctica]OZM70690.1 hypothetical protein CFN78_23745 [Amycolatopsis antarctica]